VLLLGTYLDQSVITPGRMRLERGEMFANQFIRNGPCRSEFIRAGARTLNGKYSQVVQANHTEDCFQVRSEKIGLLHVLTGEPAARGDGDEHWTIVKRPNLS
jgi:hypothetical protein